MQVLPLKCNSFSENSFHSDKSKQSLFLKNRKFIAAFSHFQCEPVFSFLFLSIVQMLSKISNTIRSLLVGDDQPEVAKKRKRTFDGYFSLAFSITVNWVSGELGLTNPTWSGFHYTTACMQVS